MPNPIKIALITPYLPAIDTSACSRKIYDFIIKFNQRGNQVDLFSFCSNGDRERVNAIKNFCRHMYLEYVKDYSCYPFVKCHLESKIYSYLKEEKNDIVQCEKAYMARYLPKNLKIPLILVEHDILSISFAQRLHFENSFIKKLILLLRKLKKRYDEQRWYGRFNKIIVFSENDKANLLKIYSKANIETIPLGINISYYPFVPQREKIYDVVFTGNLSHHPNVDGVLYFYHRVLPLVRKIIPKLTTIIVGSNPPKILQKIAKKDKNILVTGFVKDVSEYYQKSKVFIAPIRYGGGMSYKVLEAMALSIPIVSTSVGARGIDAKETIKIADTEKEFAESVIGLVNKANSNDNLTNETRAILERNYNQDTILDRYEYIYSALLKNG